MYVRFACLFIYEHVYSCHCEMGTCMYGLRVSISMSMCTVVTVRWTRVCPVCVSLYLRVCVQLSLRDGHVYVRFACLSICMSMCTAATARWARVCPVCVSLYLRVCVLLPLRDGHVYVRFACLFIYEYVYCCHCEMGTCMYGLRVSISMSMCTAVHCEMGTCMSGLRVSLSTSMCTAATARWARVCTVCVSLYLRVCVLLPLRVGHVYVQFACLFIYEYVYCCHCEMGTCMYGLRVSLSTSMCTAATASWARVCPVCVSLYLRVCVLLPLRDGHVYVRFACLFIYEHMYCCHCEMGTCMYGLRVYISMSMFTVVTARWARVCPVCVSLYL